MKRYYGWLQMALLALLALFMLPSVAQDCTSNPEKFSESQWRDCASQLQKKTDAQLNQVYESLMTRISEEDQKEIRQRQRAWIAQREQQCDAYARTESPQAGEASGYLSRYDLCLARENTQRTGTLLSVIAGLEPPAPTTGASQAEEAEAVEYEKLMQAAGVSRKRLFDSMQRYEVNARANSKERCLALIRGMKETYPKEEAQVLARMEQSFNAGNAQERGLALARELLQLVEQYQRQLDQACL
jgi:uncharacterized protein YecT (DUF1311 family)